MVDAVQSDFPLDLITSSSEADLSQAAERGDIYGGYPWPPQRLLPLDELRRTLIGDATP